MRIPDSLATLLDQGVLDAVVRPLLSGKEAEVYLVEAAGELRVAKVYKDAQRRSFQSRAEYTEGRATRNSRDQRAMARRSRYGKAQDEAAWRSTEVDMMVRLHAAGVRVPTPHDFVDGVLVMELVQDTDGRPAPRMGEMTFTPAQAKAIYARLIGEVQRMLCAGVVHGDLSEFNVLIAADGPVVIDFPQAVDAAKNLNARKLLGRDVANLQNFLARSVPGAAGRQEAEEMWELYERGELAPTTALTGRVRAAATAAGDPAALLELIDDARLDERLRRMARGESLRGLEPPPSRPLGDRADRPARGRGGGAPRPGGAAAPAPAGGADRARAPRAEGGGPDASGARAGSTGTGHRRRRRRRPPKG